MEARYRRPDEPICAGRPQSPVVDRRWQRLTRQPRTCWGAAHPRERAREFFDESPPGTCALPVSSGDSLKKSLAPYTHSRSTTAGRTADEPGEATTPRPGVLTHRGSRNSEEWGRSPGSVHEPHAPRSTRRFRTLDTNHKPLDVRVASAHTPRTTNPSTYASLPYAGHRRRSRRPGLCFERPRREAADADASADGRADLARRRGLSTVRSQIRVHAARSEGSGRRSRGPFETGPSPRPRRGRASARGGGRARGGGPWRG